jgi:hypothetical protein
MKDSEVRVRENACVKSLQNSLKKLNKYTDSAGTTKNLRAILESSGFAQKNLMGYKN